MIIEIHIPEEIIKTRIDKALVKLCPDLSRSRLKALLQKGNVKSNGIALDNPSQKISGPMDLIIQIPEAEDPLPIAQNIPIDIVYEDNDLLVINKQAGLVVHPAPGHHTGTLVNALLYHCGETLSGIGGVKRPGIVHRLDKETSGLMVVAKNDTSHKKLSEQFSDRSLSRQYIAFVWGMINNKGTVNGNIGRSKINRKKMTMYFDAGKPATTHYKREKIFGTLATKVICTLETGRTHQIRVHLTSLGNGIINDSIYGSPKRGINPQIREKIKSFTTSSDRQALHAHHIKFIHPVTNEEMEFEVDLPEDLKKLEAILDDIAKPHF